MSASAARMSGNAIGTSVMGVPEQTPLSHWSSIVASSSSLQTKPSAAKLSRQLPLASQLLGRSQVLALPSPQAVPSAAKLSTGHAPAPSHVSATSQPLPESARHGPLAAA